MTAGGDFDRRQWAPLLLASLAAVIILLVAFTRLGDATEGTAQPTPCPDSIACRALKRYDAMRAEATAVAEP